MADDKNILRSTDTNLKVSERYRLAKGLRQPDQREIPFDEEIYPFREDGFTPTPQVGVVTVLLSNTAQIYQAGLNHQGGNSANLGSIIAGAGKDNGDVYRVQANLQGLHKTHASTLFVNDRGQFSVWIKGFNSGVASGTDEYVLSVHTFSNEATPIDEESLVILWDASEEELRLYPDITNFPDTHYDIPITEADWQAEAWHQIRAKWSYQDQDWSLKFDETEATTTFEPETVSHPGWDEFTKVEIFTDLNGENDIFHDVQFLSFGQYPFDPLIGTISISNSFDTLIEKNQRNLDENIHGVLQVETTGEVLNNGSPVVITKGIGRLYLIVNAGVDTTGSITVTGNTVDRDTQAVTVGDEEVLTIDGLSTDSSSTDVNGNIIHGFTNGYLTNKWFTGTVTLTTSDVVISDLDIYHSSYEQFNDSPNITIDAFDINVKVTNASGWFHAYMYTMKPTTGNKADIVRILTLEVLVADTIADEYYRLRDRKVDTAIDGSAGGGFWIDLFFGPDPSTYWEDLTMKVWYTTTHSVATIGAAIVTLDDAYDAGSTIDFTGATTSADAVRLGATTANDPDIYLIMAMDATQQFAFLTDGNFYAGNGTTDYVKINSNGITLFDNSQLLLTMGATGAGGGSLINMTDSSGNNTHSLNTETVGVVFNEIGDPSLDFRVESDNEINMFFLDASADKIGIGTNTPAYEFDIIGDLASESAIVNSSTANTGGGMQRQFSEATSGPLSGPTGSIAVNIPSGARVIGCQLRIDTTITGPFTWNATYAGGLAQVIVAGATLNKNDKFNQMYDVNAATDIASSTVTIALTVVGGDFTAGVIRAVVYFENWIPMDDNP